MTNVKEENLTSYTTLDGDDAIRIVKDYASGADSGKIDYDNFLYELMADLGISQNVCDFRLTLTSATPVTTSDVTGATNIYIAPYKGNKIGLYDNTRWNLRSSSQITLALGTLTSGLPYDVFVYDSAGTVTADSPVAWTSSSTRTTALVAQDGVLVKTGDPTRRYLGTFVTTSTTQTEDSRSRRYLFNYYNRVRRQMYAQDTTNSWAYTTTSYREINGGSTYGTSRVGFVVGWNEGLVNAHATHMATASSGNPVVACGIGLDGSTNNAQSNFGRALGTTISGFTADYSAPVAVGAHYLAMLEYGGANVTFYGDNGTTIYQSGLVADIFA